MQNKNEQSSEDESFDSDGVSKSFNRFVKDESELFVVAGVFAGLSAYIIQISIENSALPSGAYNLLFFSSWILSSVIFINIIIKMNNDFTPITLWDHIGGGLFGLCLYGVVVGSVVFVWEEDVIKESVVTFSVFFAIIYIGKKIKRYYYKNGENQRKGRFILVVVGVISTPVYLRLQDKDELVSQDQHGLGQLVDEYFLPFVSENLLSMSQLIASFGVFLGVIHILFILKRAYDVIKARFESDIM